MGSGPACYLADKYKNIGGLILMSGFKSLREIAIEKVSFAGYLVKERFNNI